MNINRFTKYSSRSPWDDEEEEECSWDEFQQALSQKSDKYDDNNYWNLTWETSLDEYEFPKPSPINYAGRKSEVLTKEEEDQLQLAIALSQIQADAEADDDLFRQAILLSMESNSSSNSDSVSEEEEEDVYETTPPDLTDWKMKRVCRSLEMRKPKRNTVSNLLPGEPSVTTAVCAVCSDELPTGEMLRLSEKCGHYCCKGCPVNYLAGVIKETVNLNEIGCPGACKEVISWQRCCWYIPPAVVERREMALEEAEILQTMSDMEEVRSMWSSTHNPYRQNMARRRDDAAVQMVPWYKGEREHKIGSWEDKDYGYGPSW